MTDAIFGLISAAIIAIPSIIAIVYFVKKLIENKDWLFIISAANDAMVAVERAVANQVQPVSSQDKLQLALSVIATKCREAGCNFDQQAIQRVTAYIAQICKLSKTVNADKK